MTPQQRAKAAFDALQQNADVGGDHYAPCFRDCLGDNEAAVLPILAEAIRAAVHEETKACAEIVQGYQEARYAELDAAGRNRVDNCGMPLDEIVGDLVAKIMARREAQ